LFIKINLHVEEKETKKVCIPKQFQPIYIRIIKVCYRDKFNPKGRWRWCCCQKGNSKCHFKKEDRNPKYLSKIFRISQMLYKEGITKEENIEFKKHIYTFFWPKRAAKESTPCFISPSTSGISYKNPIQAFTLFDQKLDVGKLIHVWENKDTYLG